MHIVITMPIDRTFFESMTFCLFVCLFTHLVAFGTRKAQRNQAASCLKAALSGMHVDDVVEDEQGNEAVDEDNMRMTWTCMDTQTRQIQAATRRKQALMKKKK
eukprot:SAG31_NODE_1403_length_8489_cov_15.730751_4_plen_103_part_00